MDANVMDAVTLVMLAVGLAMDAFAVSITDGLCYENFHRKEALITSGAFGLFQGIMPLIGYFCGPDVQRRDQLDRSLDRADSAYTRHG